MLDWVKAVFGENETMTAEDLSNAVESHGKIVDLRSGEYVVKHKLEDALAKRKEIEAELKQVKESAQGDEALKARVTELEGLLEAEKEKAATAAKDKTRIERERAVEGKVADKRFTRFVVSEVEGSLSEDDDFAEALDNWLEANPDYAPKADDAEEGVKVSTGPAAKGGAAAKDPLMAAIDKGFGEPADAKE